MALKVREVKMIGEKGAALVAKAGMFGKNLGAYRGTFTIYCILLVTIVSVMTWASQVPFASRDKKYFQLSVAFRYVIEFMCRAQVFGYPHW